MSENPSVLFIDPSALNLTWVSDFLKTLTSSWSIEIKDFVSSDAQQVFLIFEEGRLGLKQGSQKNLNIDWTDSLLLHRFAKTSSKELLIQALVSKKNKPEVLFDMTAGMGTDSFIASKFFKKLVMVERHPLVYLMLQDALNRAMDHEKARKFADKVELVFSEAKDVLENLNKYPQPDVVYFDFMFESKKTLSNKAMETLRALEQKSTHQSLSSQETFELALKDKRIPKIVLKAKKPLANEHPPRHIFEGKVVNYYQYLNF